MADKQKIMAAESSAAGAAEWRLKSNSMAKMSRSNLKKTQPGAWLISFSTSARKLEETTYIGSEVISGGWRRLAASQIMKAIRRHRKWLLTGGFIMAASMAAVISGWRLRW